MSNIVIKAEHIAKQYRLGKIGTGTVSHDLNRWWHRVRGKEDPYLKIGERNDRATKGDSNYVWSLQDINFDIKQGDSVGIIGRNGAGKSTLLKLLSRVTTPTKGAIYTKGRIASLLEVGTGFHPEMTGRENIFLNGAILGMRKKEIQRKLDEIISFSGVERYIDTPVKRYSSGMYVRLAFAVAAHLESEILIVDEVLAVGDAEFQKKCLGKMGEVSSTEGRTILFVSHNMAAVKTLCQTAIVLKQGLKEFEGEASQAVAFYLGGEAGTLNYKEFPDRFSSAQITLHQLSVHPRGKGHEDAIDEFSALEFELHCTVHQEHERLHIAYVLKNDSGEALFTFSNKKSGVALQSGYNVLRCVMPESFLNIGSYYLDVYVIEDSRRTVFVDLDVLSFGIHEGQRAIGAWMGKEFGFIKPQFDWQVAAR
jgi:lipopolysaccharide transport system ATP-binding protein